MKNRSLHICNNDTRKNHELTEKQIMNLTEKKVRKCLKK